MENNTTQHNFASNNLEPIGIDNSNFSGNKEQNQPASPKVENGQSEQDPSSADSLILGKFRNVEELSKAYQELQKLQGDNSKELGELRKNKISTESLESSLKQILEMKEDLSNYLNTYREKYNTPEYFQDESFRNIYKEAFQILGQNLDTDRFIELLEGYVGSRVSSYEKSKLAKDETEKALDLMGYDKNNKSSITPPKKKFDEMTPQEIDEMLDRLI